jgi:outer membrane protein TolC
MGKMAFYNLIFAENIYRITLESYNNALESKKVLHERSSSGRVSRKDNIDIEADIASRATLVNDAKNDKKIAENNFKRITGLKESDSLILDGIEGIDTVKIDRKKMIRALLEREPSIKALGSKVNSSEELIKAARAEFFPTIAAFGDWTYSGMSDNRKYPHIGNKDQMDQIGVLGIKVDFPLWEGGARIARLNQARLDKSNTEWELVKVRNDLELELNNAISEYNEYINTLEANYKAVDLAEKTFKLFIELFASGQVSLLELNDAELMLTNEKIKREATIYGIRASRAKIERLTDIRI